ncbi:MAG: type II toxin-antitoxin system RelE/ParE family toxin [Pseudomonadales bacterium]|nr:type II toxin-antitoxin system RelE/ParE family toxin [Pseudomonadales bacterium]NRA16602.1 type II toxin-antitoxin system RelE/ParE family toxin [Oceanospirillaceae bacterium]
MKRDVIYMGKTQAFIDNLPREVLDMVKTNLQALQCSKCSSFSELPDWTNQGSLTDKPLQGKKLKGSHQLTIKHRDSYRVIYVAQHEEFIVVLHSFKKKVEGKAKKEIRTVETRLTRLNADIKAGNI